MYVSGFDLGFGFGFSSHGQNDEQQENIGFVSFSSLLIPIASLRQPPFKCDLIT